MGRTSTSTASLGERAAGKWQIPVFALALVALAAVALQVRSPEKKFTIEEHLAALRKLNELGLYQVAIGRGEGLLLWTDLSADTRGELTLLLARAQHGRWQAGGESTVQAAEDVISAYDRARQAFAKLEASDERHIAAAFEQLRRYELAIKHYALAAELAPPPALDDRKRMIELSIYPVGRAADEVKALLDGFIEDSANDPERLLWALTHHIEGLDAANGDGSGADLLARFQHVFTTREQQDEYAFLLALHHRGAGRYDEAERVLRDLMNHLVMGDAAYPKVGWLLGCVVMFDGRAQRPEAAIDIFLSVIASRGDHVYVSASRVAMAEALAGLRRFDESVEAYREAIEELARVPINRLVNADTVRTSLAVTADRAREAARLPVAITCETLALGLVDAESQEVLARHLKRLAICQVERARELLAEAEAQEAADAGPADAQAQAEREAVRLDARRLLVSAGEHHVRLAWMSTLNEQRASQEMWTAASLFDEATDHERAIKLLRRFVNERPQAEMIPRVLLRLGRSLQAQGRYAEAIEAYQRNLSTYPRSPFANAALIPLAECFMAQGPAHEASAELALRRIIDDSTIYTPEAPEYRDAMFLLADLLSGQGRYEESVAAIDEILQRYPNDPRRARAQFLLAHAHFKSAQEIKDELIKPEFAGERKRLEAERRERLGRAAEGFREVIAELGARDTAKLSELERVYLQDARLYSAACLFEQGAYRDALALYERAAWLYKESPASLGAYVQVINCDLFLGQVDAARTALRRAQFLVDAIADEQYAAAGGIEKREEWRRYFDWVAQTLVEE